MQIYTARQPILDAGSNIVAYELLYRDGSSNSFPNIDPHTATGKLILNTHLNQGLSKSTSGKTAFINFTEECLLSGFPELLPSNKVVIEILESVRPTDAIYKICEELFNKGYILALDDFIYAKEWHRFFKFIKLIKFDISKTPLPRIRKIVEHVKTNFDIKILAERVETLEEFTEAKAMGFDLFQGYYFYRPEIQNSNDIQPSYEILIQLLREFNKETMDTDIIIECFKSDVALAYKLLSYVNSGTLKNNEIISSIKNAIIYLGPIKTRRLMLLFTLSSLSSAKSREVINVSVIRAKTCEMVASNVAPGLKDEAFLTGLLSMIGPLMGMDNAEVLKDLPISEDIKRAILENKDQSILSLIYNASRLVQEGSWHLTTLECLKLRIDYDWLCGVLQESTVWADIFQNKIKATS